eukprot:1140403-Pelagomonas_calceolata.AAC.2
MDVWKCAGQHKEVSRKEGAIRPNRNEQDTAINNSQKGVHATGHTAATLKLHHPAVVNPAPLQQPSFESAITIS